MKKFLTIKEAMIHFAPIIQECIEKDWTPHFGHRIGSEGNLVFMTNGKSPWAIRTYKSYPIIAVEKIGEAEEVLKRLKRVWSTLGS